MIRVANAALIFVSVLDMIAILHYNTPDYFAMQDRRQCIDTVTNAKGDSGRLCSRYYQ